MNRLQKVGVWWTWAVIALGAVYGLRWLLAALDSGELGRGGNGFNRTLSEVSGLLLGPWGQELAWLVAVGCGAWGLVTLTRKPRTLREVSFDKKSPSNG